MSEKLSREQVAEALANGENITNADAGIIMAAARAWLDQGDALVIRKDEATTNRMIEALRLADHDYAMLAKAGTPEHPRGKAGYQWDCLLNALSEGDIPLSILGEHDT